jgi:hypothetical protein
VPSTKIRSFVGVLSCVLMWTGIALAAPDSLYRSLVNDAFGVGEQLEFSIGYGIIDAGTARMEVREVVQLQDRSVYRIVSTAHSNRVFDSFYKVRDTMITWVDAEGLFSWRFENHQREAEYHRDQIVDFNQGKQQAIRGNDTVDVPGFVQDVLSAFYYVRTKPLDVGDTLYIPLWSEHRIYTLHVVVLERESVKTQAGTFDCVKVQPMLESDGLFRQQGRVDIWLTDDRLHMPVQVKSRLVVGAIKAELVAYRFGELWEP